MSYRKLEVDGTVFEYSIGRTHTKIRGVGAYKNEEVGKTVTRGISPCFKNCGCDPYEFYDVVEVHPKDLAAFIKRNKLKVKSENKRRKA